MFRPSYRHHDISGFDAIRHVPSRRGATAADDRSDVLAWLSPLEPEVRHQDVRRSRVENIGEWVLRTEEFRRWCASSGGNETGRAVFFCCGDPGVGKTYISSLVIDSLLDQAKEKKATIGAFYFDFSARHGQSATDVLGALLKQLVTGLEEVLGEIARAYEDQKKIVGGRRPQLSNIVKMLQTAVFKRRVFICIDALDECLPGERLNILDSLNQILRNSPGSRIFVTGRPHIQSEFGKYFGGSVPSIYISPTEGDVVRYLHARLGEDTNPDAMDSSLEADILKKISGNISEVFLLVSLAIDAILRETTIYRRRRKLDEMTNGLGLGDAYSAALCRIKGQCAEKARLGMAALMWISHAERPLKPNELCHALAVEIGSRNPKIDSVPSIGDLLVCCQGLVVVDREASTVRLIHITLQEYLWFGPEHFATPQSTLAETCLSYLNSQQVRALSTSTSPDLRGTPFLEYSSVYWGVHAKRELLDRTKSLVWELFYDYNNHISTKILLRAQRWDLYADNFHEPSQFSALHCACIFGIVEIVAGLVTVEGYDINQRDCVGNTPLLWAALNGYEGVVEILLRRNEVDPGKPNRRRQTPLWCAAEKGHEGVVKRLLIRSDVDPNRPDDDNQTPLLCAAQNGHEGVVKMLLDRKDVNPNRPDRDGQSPLWYAARNGLEGVVKRLLERGDVNLDKSDKCRQTPLWCAARNGHEGVVKRLLEQDGVNPNVTDGYGRAPLLCAAQNGHEGVVKMLLDRKDVDPNRPDGDGQTPLWYAARNGLEGVVKRLLERGDVDPDEPNKYRQTPLWCAARNGHEGVVKRLLGRGGINPDRPDSQGQTPLWCAARNGHEGVVEILLGRNEVDPGKPNRRRQTPLWCAAEKGHEGVVERLLRRKGVSPDRLDSYRETPLCCAARNGHQEVVKILLGREDISPDRPDISGQTPLSYAAWNGHEEVVKRLLGRGDVSPDRPDNTGRTPLCYAAGDGHSRVVELLLGRGEVKPGDPDGNGRAPLSHAARNGHEGVVKILLGRDEVNPDEPDEDGQTPLSHAVQSGHEGIVKILLGRDDAKLDRLDN